MKRLKLIIPAVIVLTMILACGAAAANDVYTEGEFGDNVEVELAYTSSPYFVDGGTVKKTFKDWNGESSTTNTGRYIYCNVTDKETGEQLYRNEDYKVSVMWYNEDGYWEGKGTKVDELGSFKIFFSYCGDEDNERGFIKIPFEVTEYTVKASDITVLDVNDKLPYKYTGKSRKYVPADIKVGASTFGTRDSYFWTLKSATYSNTTYVGTATAKYTFTFKNGFKGTVTKTFKYDIIPKDVTLSTFSKGRTTITAKWKKHSTQTTGFRVKVYRLTGSDDEDEAGGEGGTSWKYVKTVYAKSKTATSKQITGLKKNTSYMIKVQAYKTVNGKRYYSESAVKQIKTSK